MIAVPVPRKYERNPDDAAKRIGEIYMDRGYGRLPDESAMILVAIEFAAECSASRSEAPHE